MTFLSQIFREFAGEKIEDLLTFDKVIDWAWCKTFFKTQCIHIHAICNGHIDWPPCSLRGLPPPTPVASVVSMEMTSPDAVATPAPSDASFCWCECVTSLMFGADHLSSSSVDDVCRTQTHSSGHIAYSIVVDTDLERRASRLDIHRLVIHLPSASQNSSVHPILSRLFPRLDSV